MRANHTLRGPTLGIIPNWYFSSDPKQNPHINPFIGPPMPNGQVGLVMVDQNPLGYVMRDESPLQGIAEIAAFTVIHRKKIAIGAGIVGAALLANWLLR